MLSPIRAASSSASAYSQGTSLSIQVRSDMIVDAAAPVAPPDFEDMSAGRNVKIDMLLIAIRQRMVEVLLDVLSKAGEALNLPRHEDETDLAYATRVSAAIQSLPSVQRDEAERQLSSHGMSLPLKLLAGVLQNPVGINAAKLIAVLEIGEGEHGELAMQRVERLYQEEGGDAGMFEERPAAPMSENSLKHYPQTAQPQNTRSAPPVDPQLSGQRPTPEAAHGVAKASSNGANQGPTPTLPPQLAPAEPVAAASPLATLKQGLASLLEGPRQAVASGPNAAQAAPLLLAQQPVAPDNDLEPMVPSHWAAIPALVDAELLSTALTIIGKGVDLPVRPPAIPQGALNPPSAAVPHEQTQDARQASQAGLAPPSGPLPSGPPPIEAAAAARAFVSAASGHVPQAAIAEDLYAAVAAPLPAQKLEGFGFVVAPYSFAPDGPEAPEEEPIMTRDRDEHREEQGHGRDEDEKPDEPAEPEDPPEDEAPLPDLQASIAYERYFDA